MNNSDAAKKGARFRELHNDSDILILPNPWDAGTARLLESLGFRGLATTSAGLAFSLGRRDGDGAVSADETFHHVSAIIRATRLPVSADLENGFDETPEDVEASRALPYPFVLTARAENFIRGRPEFDDALRRLKAYEKAGAAVLYAPGLPSDNAIRLACQTLAKPFNYVAGVEPTRLTIQDLKKLGVRRVTIGTSFVRAALAAFYRAAKKVRDRGTSTYLESLPKVADFNELIDPRPPAGSVKAAKKVLSFKYTGDALQTFMEGH